MPYPIPEFRPWRPRFLQLDFGDFESVDLYGNFDIILDRFSRIFQLYTGRHAPRAIIYFVSMLIGR